MKNEENDFGSLFDSLRKESRDSIHASYSHRPELMAVTERLPDNTGWTQEDLANRLFQRIIEIIKNGERACSYVLIEYDEKLAKLFDNMGNRLEPYLAPIIYDKLRNLPDYNEEEGTIFGWDGDELSIQVQAYHFNEEIPILIVAEVLFSHWDTPFFWEFEKTPEPYCYYMEVFKAVVAQYNFKKQQRIIESSSVIVDTIRKKEEPYTDTFYQVYGTPEADKILFSLNPESIGTEMDVILALNDFICNNDIDTDIEDDDC